MIKGIADDEWLALPVETRQAIDDAFHLYWVDVCMSRVMPHRADVGHLREYAESAFRAGHTLHLRQDRETAMTDLADMAGKLDRLAEQFNRIEARQIRDSEHPTRARLMDAVTWLLSAEARQVMRAHDPGYLQQAFCLRAGLERP